MSERVATVIKWLQYAVQIIGAIIALIGGGQAVQIANNAAFQSSENISNAGTLTLSGVLTTVLAPAIAWLVKTLWAWKAGKGASPVVDYAAALFSLNVLRQYLAGKPDAEKPLESLKVLVVSVESDNVVPPAKVA